MGAEKEGVGFGRGRSSALTPRAEGGVRDGKSFWVSLEFRLCGEFAGLRERRYCYFWCDGFIPSHYLLDDPRAEGNFHSGEGNFHSTGARKEKTPYTMQLTVLR